MYGGAKIRRRDADRGHFGSSAVGKTARVGLGKNSESLGACGRRQAVVKTDKTIALGALLEKDQRRGQLERIGSAERMDA